MLRKSNTLGSHFHARALAGTLRRRRRASTGDDTGAGYPAKALRAPRTAVAGRDSNFLRARELVRLAIEGVLQLPFLSLRKESVATIQARSALRGTARPGRRRNAGRSSHSEDPADLIDQATRRPRPPGGQGSAHQDEGSSGQSQARSDQIHGLAGSPSIVPPGAAPSRRAPPHSSLVVLRPSVAAGPPGGGAVIDFRVARFNRRGRPGVHGEMPFAAGGESATRDQNAGTGNRKRRFGPTSDC